MHRSMLPENYSSTYSSTGQYFARCSVHVCAALANCVVKSTTLSLATASSSNSIGNAHGEQNLAAIATALEIMKPIHILWHQDQAGRIPNACPEEMSSSTTSEWWRKYRKRGSLNLYWQLYKSLAAYRMAVKREREGGFTYDWILRARFDLAWVRPLPPLRLFSQEVVWLPNHYW